MTKKLALLLTVALLATPALADSAKKNNKGSSDQSSTVEEVLGDLITDAERSIIFDYIGLHGAGIFGSPQGLPPGIAKNLARGKPLPPGIAKRYFPNDLLVRLPPREGYEWQVIDNEIVLVAVATAVIVDVLFDVF